ncbi:hypothetical protein HII31_09882 [Pseudocercospora fuligena]|uniref:Uncharacterized protein n=1 Tax=Pseudocercospora fuligena TaxID=685502 RepID=A0A8H6RDK2_9PEZI|nr:hypothetical protein HII31_09882 [Pseudocercospora fuligena]
MFSNNDSSSFEKKADSLAKDTKSSSKGFVDALGNATGSGITTAGEIFGQAGRWTGTTVSDLSTETEKGMGRMGKSVMDKARR